MVDTPFIKSSLSPSEPKNLSPSEPKKWDKNLRPDSLSDFVGQESVRERLSLLMKAAQEREEPVCHCLFHGPPGLGKTTLAHLIANTMGSHIVVTSGPVIEKAGELAALLTQLQQGDILFIDEIHRLSRTVEEYLYPAMEDYLLDLIIESGPGARSVRMKLNRFTLVGATTRIGLLSSPLRSRFPFALRLDYYSLASLEQILLRSSRLFNLSLDLDAAAEIASRSRGTPRIANHLLLWVRDYAQTHRLERVDRETAAAALEMLSIDRRGLDDLDKKMLQLIIDHHGGGPVGLNTLAVAMGEEKETISEVYEPYLLMQGFIKRTARGREVTQLAYAHLGKPLPHKFIQGELL